MMMTTTMEVKDQKQQQQQQEEEGIFEDGRTSVATVDIPASWAPKPIVAKVPAQKGTYPILVMFHGFIMNNSYYTQLLHHVASHAYIAIAPQMYNCPTENPKDEVSKAEKMLEWLPSGLAPFLPSDVGPDFSRVTVAGHSRGGKTAFQLALNRRGSPRPSEKATVKICAVVGIEPVDGWERIVSPEMAEHSLELGVPVLILGMGLAATRCFPFPACAPVGRNHAEFQRVCGAPVYCLVAKSYGHMDVLNDEDDGHMDLKARLASYLCPKGASRRPARRFAGGCIVAFLDWLQGRADVAFRRLIHDPVSVACPVDVDAPLVYETADHVT